MKRRILYIFLLMLFAKVGMGITPTLNLITGSPAPFINCGLIKFNVTGYPSEAHYYRLEVYSDATFSNSPTFISDPYLVTADALSDKSGYFKAIFFNSADNQIFGFDANYSNELIVKPNPVITSSPNIILPNFTYGSNAVLTATTTPKAISPWEINNNSFISTVNNVDPKKLNIVAILVGGPSEIKFTDINGCFKIISLNVIKATPVISLTNSIVTYNGLAQPVQILHSVPGSFSNTLYGGISFVNGPVNVGSYSITTNFTPSDQINYNSLNNANAGNYIINKAPVTISNVELTKIYDGTPNINSITNSYSGIISGDNVVLSAVATNFSDKIIGNAYTSTITFSLITSPSTGKENNYFILGGDQKYITNGSITSKPIVVTALASNKEYDGNATANVSLTDDRIAGDVLTIDKTGATFDTKDAGTGKSVTVTGIDITGTDAGNYSLTSTTATSTANITAKPIVITATASNKEYDGTRTANASLTDNRITGDVLTIDKTGALFDTKNVGTGKSVTVSGISITGTDAGNYSLTSTTATSTANITSKPIVVTALASNKEYDGNATANVSLTDDRIAGDVLTIDKTGALFDTKDAGTGKSVTVSGIAITGTDAGNYSLTINTATTTADITAKPIVVTAVASNKEYDGTTTAIVSLTDDRITGDVLTIDKTGALFDTKDVGTGKSVTVSGISITGTHAGNYSLTSTTATSTANITAKPVVITATASNKEYDGTTTAIVSLTDDRIAGDVLTIDKTGTLFDTKDVGTGKSVTVSGISITGTDAGNYSLTSTTATSTANITAKPIVITATASNKEYDGSKSAIVSLADDRITGDVLTIDKTGALFDTKDVGTGKSVTVSGIAITGTDAGNYSLTSTTATSTANITAKPIVITATASNKEYDGTTTAIVSLTDDRITGDVLTIDKTGATFDTKDAGTGKSVTVTGIAITGTDAGNYSLTINTATTTADITPKPITVTGLTTSNKVYDRTNVASLTGGTLVGVISPDVVNFTASGTFSQSTVGTAIAITSSSTIDNTNYILTQPTLTARDITAKPITITGVTTSNKVYDRTNIATLTGGTLVGVISPDVVNLTQAGNYAQYKVGNAIAITSTSTIDNINYVLTQPILTARDITPKSLTVNAIADDKLFDGNKNAIVTLLPTNVIGGDVISLPYTLAEFDSPDVGTNKLVTVIGISIGGVDAGNYSLTSTSVTTTANITAPATIIFDLPNAFTPNGDGKNDVLKLITNAGVTELRSFKIFSRSGNLVFESRDVSRGWDGRYNGNLLPIDIYYWTAVYVDRNNVTNSKTGTVLLLK